MFKNALVEKVWAAQVFTMAQLVTREWNVLIGELVTTEYN